MAPLTTYNKKRNFKETAEPKGKAEKKNLFHNRLVCFSGLQEKVFIV